MTRASKGGPDGVVVVDKPVGWTSHDAVARVRRLCATSRVGHAGTLDPMATGVLVMGIGRGTRLLTYLVGLSKTYTATLRLGAATTTDDAEGEVTTKAPAGLVAGLETSLVDAAVAKLTGAIEQVPSSVSAIKVEGKRAYARVRAGETVELAARSVVVHSFAVTDRRLTEAAGIGPVLDLEVRVKVSSGTYVRALARDLGADLGVGGHLTALRREAVGPFTAAQAQALDPAPDSLSMMGLGQAAQMVLPVKHLSLPEVAELGNGRLIVRGAGDGIAALRTLDTPGLSKSLAATQVQSPGPTAGIGPDGALVAILSPQGPRWRPVAVFQPA